MSLDGAAAAPHRRIAQAVAVAVTVLAFLGIAATRPAAAGGVPCDVCRPAAPTPPRIRLEQVAEGLASPVYLTHAGDRSGRLFLVEQQGTIRIARDGRLLPRPFLDIRSRVLAGGERGLLSVAFHPRYAQTGRVFVNYTARPDGRTMIAEYRVSRSDPDAADPSERVLLEIPQPYPNHNGGLNTFGPDG
ncbi:MAG: PQQ-dependent sugar dehydrogenase, partial [Armatimonadota bacterium]|nr:PQQ-dependent sugar dehydrogenase [Armatimonadota bacterium]